MKIELLRFEHKRIRAEVIKEYLKDKTYKGVVCFSCGNASRELKNIGLNVIDISPKGDFIANRWFEPGEINEIFKEYFDATSGHLSMELMNKIADRFYIELNGVLDDVNYVPTGSGETLICLKLAFPDKKFVAVYNLDEATEYSDNCVLNNLVKLLADEIIYEPDKEIDYAF